MMKHPQIDYEEVLDSATKHARATNPFTDWERRFNNLPSRASTMLDSGLLYWFCGMPSEIVGRFIKGAHELAARIIREGRFAQAPDEGSNFLVANGKHKTFRVRAFAEAFLEPRWPDRDDLDTSAESAIAASREFARKADWDVMQSTYLCAAELELVRGTPERAHELLRKRYSFKNSQARHLALLHVCEDILEERRPDSQQEVREFFDMRRMPSDRPAINEFPAGWIVYDERYVQVLQMALIVHRYIDGRGPDPNWARIRELVIE